MLKGLLKHGDKQATWNVSHLFDFKVEGFKEHSISDLKGKRVPSTVRHLTLREDGTVQPPQLKLCVGQFQLSSLTSERQSGLLERIGISIRSASLSLNDMK